MSIEKPTYTYFLLCRPASIGTFPQPSDNPPVDIVDYRADGRVWQEYSTVLAWGEVIYKEPLTSAEITAYQLQPSRNNPDTAKTMYEQAQTVGPWEEKNRLPEQKRMTWWHPDFGEYRVKEFVTQKQLAEQYKIVLKFSRLPAQKSKRKQPSQHEDR